MSRLRRPRQFILRTAGSWSDGGRYVEAPEPAPTAILAGVHPLSADKVEFLPEGRRHRRAVQVFTSQRLNVPQQAREGFPGHPGDLLLHNGSRWLLISEEDHHVIQDSAVNHYLYVASEEIEHSEGEDVP